MITCAGIDLGGTKSEIQLFDANWDLVDKRRAPTPSSYEQLVTMIADQIAWAVARADAPIPIGIGAAGLLDADQHAFAANLPAMGKPFPADIERATGHRITYVNDCRALALSEAAFGAGHGYRTVMSLILGTGVGGGVVFDGKLRSGPTHWGGEFGHMPASASLVQKYDLPIYTCGCGRLGCIETYISGPGLARMASDVLGQVLDPIDIGPAKHIDEDAKKIWSIWCDLTSDLLLTLTQAVDPDIIVIGGGLSKIDRMSADLEQHMTRKQFAGFGLPVLTCAQGGDVSGARGAALAATQRLDHD